MSNKKKRKSIGPKTALCSSVFYEQIIIFNSIDQKSEFSFSGYFNNHITPLILSPPGY